MGLFGDSTVVEGSRRGIVGERIVARQRPCERVGADGPRRTTRAVVSGDVDPSSDYYGGKRPGANLFAESVVCLDANNGKIKWYFQAIHHGLWDWDFPAPPNLVTITVNGRRIDAVAQVSKQGFTYVFDRVTGVPVWPIVERPVPTDSDVPGEKPYPTQPFPTKPRHTWIKVRPSLTRTT
jgi:glucose dehydrogenase